MKSFALIAACLSLGTAVWAGPVELHYYAMAGCPDCEIMESFLEELRGDEPELEIVRYEVRHRSATWDRMQAMAAAYGVVGQRVPMVFVGNVGTTGASRAIEARIRDEVLRCAEEGCPSPAERVERKPPEGYNPLPIVVVASVVLALLLIFAGPGTF